jgi:tetratricopeptide (TPR) repeat protein
VRASATVAASVGLALLILPSPAVAQHEKFVEALGEFTAALPGTYGDEGAAARASLDRMERGLAEWDKSLREYESNLLSIGPTASAARLLDMHRAMGLLDIARGRFDEAVQEFNAAGAISSEPRLRLLSGAAYEAAGRSADALKAYRAAWMLDAANPVAAYMLADASFRSASAPPPEALAALSAVVDRIAAGQYAGDSDPFIAAALLPDDLSETPMFVPWWYSGAYASLERAEYAKGVQALRAASAQDLFVVTPAPPSLTRGSSALRAGQVARAIDEFAAAVRDAPGPDARRMLGLAYWLSADDEHGIEQLEQAIRLSPTDERSRLTLARVLEDAGEAERAERLLAETVQTIPSSATAHSRLGRLYASSSRIEDAAREYEAAVRIGALSGAAPLLLEIGDLYRRALDSERAAAAFARAVALRPNDVVGHRERGRALLQLERPDAALVELAAALLVSADDYESLSLIGQIDLEAGRHARAARVLTRAIAIDPDKPEAYYTLATALARSGQVDEAARHRETFARLQARALEDQRHTFESGTSRLDARALTEKKEFERAAAAWTRIVADAPAVAANHAGLAAALAGRGQLEAAAEEYEKALTLDAGAAVYREVIAFYDRIGQRDAAARTRAKLARTRQAAFGLPVPLLK